MRNCVNINCIIIREGLSGHLTPSKKIARNLSMSVSIICFYRAMHFSAKRGIAIACRLSVRLSVRPSVRL